MRNYPCTVRHTLIEEGGECRIEHFVKEVSLTLPPSVGLVLVDRIFDGSGKYRKANWHVQIKRVWYDVPDHTFELFTEEAHLSPKEFDNALFIFTRSWQEDK